MASQNRTKKSPLARKIKRRSRPYRNYSRLSFKYQSGKGKDDQRRQDIPIDVNDNPEAVPAQSNLSVTENVTQEAPAVQNPEQAGPVEQAEIDAAVTDNVTQEAPTVQNPEQAGPVEQAESEAADTENAGQETTEGETEPEADVENPEQAESEAAVTQNAGQETTEGETDAPVESNALQDELKKQITKNERGKKDAQKAIPSTASTSTEKRAAQKGPARDPSSVEDGIENLLKQVKAPVTAPSVLQRPDPELLKNMTQTPKWLIQWCILKSSAGCHKCYQKLKTLDKLEASEIQRKAELERIAIHNDIIKSQNDIIQAKVDRMKIENEIQKRTPYLLGQRENMQERRTSPWKSIFDNPIFKAFKK